MRLKNVQPETISEFPELDLPGLKNYQREALTVLRARLDTSDPGFSGSDEVKRALDEIKLYLNSWVLPMIDVVAGGGYPMQRQDVSLMSARIKIKRAEASAKQSGGESSCTNS